MCRVAPTVILELQRRIWVTAVFRPMARWVAKCEAAVWEELEAATQLASTAGARPAVAEEDTRAFSASASLKEQRDATRCTREILEAEIAVKNAKDLTGASSLSRISDNTATRIDALKPKHYANHLPMGRPFELIEKVWLTPHSRSQPTPDGCSVLTLPLPKETTKERDTTRLLLQAIEAQRQSMEHFRMATAVQHETRYGTMRERPV